MVDEPEGTAQEPDELDLLRLREIGTAWSMVRACLRTAARTGLPHERERLEIARELEAAAEWLRMAGRPKAPTTQPRASAPAVQIWRSQRHRREPLRLRFDRRLWDGLNQPAFLQLVVEAGQVQLRPATEADGKRVRVGQAGPQLAYADGEVPIGAGVYAAEVRAGAIVLGARVEDADGTEEAEE